MSTVKEIPLPEKSLLHGRSFDFDDCFVATLSRDTQPVSELDAVKALFLSAPKWVSALMWLRNQIVRLFGLKTGEGDESLERIMNRFEGKVGDAISLFKVVETQPGEIIFSEKDSHLDFWLSLLVEQEHDQQRILATTTVRFNNRVGQIYFTIIKPFHKMIVRTMLRRAVKLLNHETN